MLLSQKLNLSDRKKGEKMSRLTDGHVEREVESLVGGWNQLNQQKSDGELYLSSRKEKR